MTTSLPLPVPAGEKALVSIKLKKGGCFTAGTIVEVRLHSAIGLDYPESTVLD